MEGRLLLDVVVTKSSTVFKALACENKTLLVWRDAFFVLDFRLNVLHCVRGFNIESNCLAGESLDEYLHAASKSKD